MRTSKQVEEILSTEPEMAEKIRTLCGLPMSTYFSALKMQWLLQNVASVQEAVIQDRCLLGTVDSWLVWVSRVCKFMYKFISTPIKFVELDWRSEWWAALDGCDQCFQNHVNEHSHNGVGC